MRGVATAVRPTAVRPIALLAVAVCIVLGACGGSGTAGKSGSASGDGAGSFPVTIDHAFGTTEIPSEPKRVVTLGLSDQDPVLALGVKPIAVAPWYGDYPDQIWPWAKSKMGDTEPVVLNGGVRNDAEPPFEEIASLEPDLIVSLYSGTDEPQYKKLAAIAPTVVPTKKYLNFTITWQETTRMVGEALGKPDKAKELVDDLEGRFVEIAADNPQFEGKTAVIAERFEENNAETIVRSGNDVRAKFFAGLGFTIPAELGGNKADDVGEITVPDEQMSELSQDLLVWNVGWDKKIRPEIEKKRLYRSLPVTKQGKVLWIDDPVVSGAFSWGTVLSLDYALDSVVPELQKVIKK